MFVRNKISTQSYSAKFLYWGDHVNSVPDLAASPPPRCVTRSTNPVPEISHLGKSGYKLRNRRNTITSVVFFQRTRYCIIFSCLQGIYHQSAVDFFYGFRRHTGWRTNTVEITVTVWDFRGECQVRACSTAIFLKCTKRNQTITPITKIFKFHIVFSNQNMQIILKL